ncbi:MAG: chemotaxis protein CheW [Gammaproteobacteria bacterium]|nr:chemotaxis protein CheW [Gammaproteobacteria bacterium]
MAVAAQDSLRTLKDHPFDLLCEMERRSRAAAAGAHGHDVNLEEWVGVAFRLGRERFVVSRDEVREVLMVPPAVTRVPGAKSWIKGLANVRGHLLPLVDLREFLGSGIGGTERGARVLVANSDEYPVGLIVDEVFGFRRFLDNELNMEVPATVIRADRFLDGCFQRGGEAWPVFSLSKLLDARDFQRAAAD